MGYDSVYETYRCLIEDALDKALPAGGQPWPEQGIPEGLAQAMRYSLLCGGKRLRPVLLLASHSLLSQDCAAALPFALAIEMIHTYSLIHDDLPAMDNDDMRRGKPSSHKAFGEAMAILAGDALLNEAFEQMAASKHPRALAALSEIASRSGARGMIAGQAGDMAMEGKTPDAKMLRYIHRRKTADLITAAVCAGLALGGAGEPQMQAGRDYGFHLGLAFQIADDILDITGEQAALGKQTHKDAASGKLTWPAVYGIQGARKAAAEHIELAVSSSRILEGKEGFLSELAARTLERTN